MIGSRPVWDGRPRARGLRGATGPVDPRGVFKKSKTPPTRRGTLARVSPTTGAQRGSAGEQSLRQFKAASKRQQKAETRARYLREQQLRDARREARRPAYPGQRFIEGIVR